MEIPKFEDFADIKEKERVEKALYDFQIIFHEAVKSTKDIGKEFCIPYKDYVMIMENNFLKKYMNDLGWDFSLNEVKGMRWYASHPTDVYILSFNKLVEN